MDDTTQQKPMITLEWSRISINFEEICASDEEAKRKFDKIQHFMIVDLNQA